jgi:chromosome segregation ATPase
MNYAYEVAGEFVTKKVYDHVVEINEKVERLGEELEAERVISELLEKERLELCKSVSKMTLAYNESDRDKQKLEKELADYKEWMTEPIVKFQTEFQEMKKELEELKEQVRWRDEDPESFGLYLISLDKTKIAVAYFDPAHGWLTQEMQHPISYSRVNGWKPLQEKGGE